MSGVQVDSLITDDIFAWSRNPQNVGWGLVLLGIALVGRSGAALLLTAVFWLATHLYLVGHKEPQLERAFGAAYRRYLARTSCYLRLPRRS